MTNRIFKHGGFTLIEALAVVSIIGILAALTGFVFVGASARSRDARRKSDLVAVSLGFQARHDAQTCSNPADIGYYPGRSIIGKGWLAVSDLATLDNDCGSFSEYLITIPSDPQDPNNAYPYRFDLSRESGSIIGKHFRLVAHLEKASLQSQGDFSKMVTVWTGSFGGAKLPPSTPGEEYGYIIGN